MHSQVRYFYGAVISLGFVKSSRNLQWLLKSCALHNNYRKVLYLVLL